MRDRFRKKLAELISNKLRTGDYNQVSLNYVGSNALLETLEEEREKAEKRPTEQQGG